MADKAIEPGRKSTERYLPEKRESRKGKQFVENTDRAKKARKAVSKAEKRKMGQG